MMMKFVQRQAGNAQGWLKARLGTAHRPSRFRMPRSTPFVTALLVSALALPAAAGAADPLLSGYAGPGDGEQVVLGATVVGGKGGGGSSGGGGTTAQPQDQSLRATTTAATPSTGDSGRATSTLTRKPQRKKSSSSSSQQKAHGGTTTHATTTSTAAAPLPGAPAVVAYPTRAGAVSGPPISVGGAVLLVLGLTALGLVALGLRRLIKPPSGRPSLPQVSGL
jgi:hypothetical protein